MNANRVDVSCDLLLGRLWEDYEGSFQFRREVPLWRIRLNLWWRRTRLWRYLNPYYAAREQWATSIRDEQLELLDRMTRGGLCICTRRSPGQVTCPWHGWDEFAWQRRRAARKAVAAAPSRAVPAGTSSPAPASTPPAHATNHPAPATTAARDHEPSGRHATPQPAATQTQPTSLHGGTT